MRFPWFVLLAGLLCSAAAVAAEPAAKPDAAAEKPAVPTDAEAARILKQLESLSPYQTPELELKTDEQYAHIPRDVFPYGPFARPFKRHFLTQMEYGGPGRAIPEPEHVKTVKLGFLGPLYPTVSVATGGKSHEESMGRKMLQGCQLAVEEANARGGYLRRRIPFELVSKNDNGLWGSSGNEIIQLAYKDDVWTILGTIDGANSHIAIRVALKIEIPMMNTGDTDPTFIETNIPWVFRCIGDDRQQCYLLSDYLYRKLGYKRVGIIRASNRYGRFGVREIMDSSRRLGTPILAELAYRLGTEDFSLQLERIKAANVQAVVHWGDAEDGARILNQMRKMGMQQPYFACDRCASPEFLAIAGKNAEGVVCGFPWDPDRKDPKLDAFRAAFRKRFNEEAETYATHAYDGTNMVLWAIQNGGLNRAKIRDMLAYRTQPWPGVTGDIQLSAALDDIGDVYLARCENGRWRYYSREDLSIPRGPMRAAGDNAEMIGK